MTRWIPLAVLGCAAALAGCRDERYFGPYDLEVPTEIEELASARTFRFPLDEGDNLESQDLATCLAEEPDRPVPCICDYPVLTVGEQEVRVDYRLTHKAGPAVNVMVWVGRQALPREQDPDEVPDLPRVGLLAEHHHQLGPGRSIDSSFLESEMADVDLAWTATLHPECPASQPERPAPLELLFGLALDSPQEGSRVSLAFSLRIREND